jgi:hypothetical protein
MRKEIDELLAIQECVASRAELVRRVGRIAVDHEIRLGHLVAVFPRAYARPWYADDRSAAERAALVSVGGDVAISHLSALRRLGLPVPSDVPLHVTAFQPRHPRGVPGTTHRASHSAAYAHRLPRWSADGSRGGRSNLELASLKWTGTAGAIDRGAAGARVASDIAPCV